MAGRAEEEEDQLPIISNPNIESRYKDNRFSHLLNTKPHRQEPPEEKEEGEAAQIALEESEHVQAALEEGEKAQEEHHHKH